MLSSLYREFKRNDDNIHIAVVIPCFKTHGTVLSVINAMGPEVSTIIIVDDCDPEHAGDLVEAECSDPRINIIRHKINLGVGGAVISGYKAAISMGCDFIVKLDGDGQMDPKLIPVFVEQLRLQNADYTKGNRFAAFGNSQQMPLFRKIGNVGLSFLNKVSSGYWNTLDPTNGYTAISASVCALLPLEKIEKRYFFETDMLFQLGLLKAKVVDIPMRAVYQTETSGLNPLKVLFPFFIKNLSRMCKRILIQYYLQDFEIGSIYLPLGLMLTLFGLIFGTKHWLTSISLQETMSAGTVMLAGLPFMLGIQMLLAFIAEDIRRIPRQPLSPLITCPSIANINELAEQVGG